MPGSISGTHYANRTWSDNLGQLQSGVVDMWAADATMSVERYDDFLYTTPFALSKYAAVMKRPIPTFYIDINSVTAGIDFKTYGLMFAILFGAFLFSAINERIQHRKHRNTVWDLVLLQFPCNGTMLAYQRGVTRKCLMTASGFAILILSSLYQAKYSEQMMVPYPPPEITLSDIEKLVSSGHAKILLKDAISLLTYLTTVSSVFATSHTNKQILFSKFNETFEQHAIDTQNAIYINAESTVLNLLGKMDADLCSNYVFIPFNEWKNVYSALIMRKGRKDMLERLNFNVADRYSYVDNFMEIFHVSEACRQRLFPVLTSQTSYFPLKLVKISGALMFLFIFLCFSTFVLLLEKFSVRWQRRETPPSKRKLEQVKFPIKVEHTLSSDKRRLIMELHKDIMEAIANDKY
jgi:hypothetical protein